MLGPHTSVAEVAAEGEDEEEDEEDEGAVKRLADMRTENERFVAAAAAFGFVAPPPLLPSPSSFATTLKAARARTRACRTPRTGSHKLILLSIVLPLLLALALAEDKGKDAKGSTTAGSVPDSEPLRIELFCVAPRSERKGRGGEERAKV